MAVDGLVVDQDPRPSTKAHRGGKLTVQVWHPPARGTGYRTDGARRAGRLGFLSGAVGQYDPIITQDNSTLGVQEGKDGAPYYFPDDVTDKAVGWVHGLRAQDTAKPWFMYYSTGCAHAPHHVARAWTDKYEGKFDGGWDKLREQTFERQKRLGIIPQDTERPDLFPAWDSLNDADREMPGTP